LDLQQTTEEKYMTPDDIEVQTDIKKKENEAILSSFSKHLSDNGLKEKTVKKHIDNVDFYINYYLLYEDFVTPAKGISLLDEFFTYFFPRKAMWACESTTKESIASLKKFYSFLRVSGLVEETSYKRLLEEIKEEKEFWLHIYASNH
jgi:site-specific recombinase XerD